MIDSALVVGIVIVVAMVAGGTGVGAGKRDVVGWGVFVSTGGGVGEGFCLILQPATNRANSVNAIAEHIVF